MTSPQGPQGLSQGLLLDSSTRDLHLLQGESRLSYHQSLLSQFSPLLQEVSLQTPKEDQEISLQLAIDSISPMLDSLELSKEDEEESLEHRSNPTFKQLYKEDQEVSLLDPSSHFPLQLPREDQDVPSEARFSQQLPREEEDMLSRFSREKLEASLKLANGARFSLQLPREEQQTSLQLIGQAWQASLQGKAKEASLQLPGQARKASLQELAGEVEGISQRERQRRRKRERSVSPPAAPCQTHRNSMDEKEQEEVERQLAMYVKEGSREFRHETKKVRDRLYKRLKRDGQPIDIKKPEVQA